MTGSTLTGHAAVSRFVPSGDIAIKKQKDRPRRSLQFTVPWRKSRSVHCDDRAAEFVRFGQNKTTAFAAGCLCPVTVANAKPSTLRTGTVRFRSILDQ